MPSIPLPPDQPPSRADLAARAARGVSKAVAGTTPLRLVLLVIIAAVCVAFAPLPWAPIGVAALVLIGLDAGRSTR